MSQPQLEPAAEKILLIDSTQFHYQLGVDGSCCQIQGGWVGKGCCCNPLVLLNDW